MTSNARARVRLRGFEVAKKGEDPTVDERNPAKQLIWLISHYLQLFLHPRWLAGFLKHQQYHPRFFESSSLIYYQFNSFIPLLKGFHMFHLSQVVQISSIDSMNTKKTEPLPSRGCFWNSPKVSVQKGRNVGGNFCSPNWHLYKKYCWWKKSCTSWYGKYPMIYRVLYIPGGAGFLPSTVSQYLKLGKL